MSELNFVVVNLPFGIFYERTSFWLDDFNYVQLKKNLIFKLTLNEIKNGNYNAPREKTPFTLNFLNVSSFSMYQYDDFERKYIHHSQSNFDYMSLPDKEENLYLLWSYDECFEIYAKGFTFQ